MCRDELSKRYRDQEQERLRLDGLRRGVEASCARLMRLRSEESELFQAVQELARALHDYFRSA